MELKPYFAAAEAADNEVKQIARKINDRFKANEIGKALTLAPAFYKAKTKAENANDLYLSIRDALAISVVPLFGKASPSPKKLIRSKFDTLDASQRMAFVLAGGEILDFPS